MTSSGFHIILLLHLKQKIHCTYSVIHSSFHIDATSVHFFSLKNMQMICVAVVFFSIPHHVIWDFS
jgi:hypothetical protein